MWVEKTKPICSSEKWRQYYTEQIRESKKETHNSKANTNAPHKKVIKAKERTSNKRKQWKQPHSIQRLENQQTKESWHRFTIQ